MFCGEYSTFKNLHNSKFQNKYIIVVVVYIDEVRRLRTVATNEPIVHLPDNI
jgi:hypothetical protein